MCLAKRGRCSLSWIPGTEVAIGLNSPRTSLGAAGFMSHISRWLGPPFKKTRIQESALGACPVPAEREFARSKPGRLKPKRPLPPTCSMWRREILKGPVHLALNLLIAGLSAPREFHEYL